MKAARRAAIEAAAPAARWGLVLGTLGRQVRAGHAGRTGRAGAGAGHAGVAGTHVQDLKSSGCSHHRLRKGNEARGLCQLARKQASLLEQNTHCCVSRSQLFTPERRPLAAVVSQGNPRILASLQQLLAERGRSYVTVLLSEVTPTKLAALSGRGSDGGGGGGRVEAWVQVRRGPGSQSTEGRNALHPLWPACGRVTQGSWERQGLPALNTDTVCVDAAFMRRWPARG